MFFLNYLKKNFHSFVCQFLVLLNYSEQYQYLLLLPTVSPSRPHFLVSYSSVHQYPVSL